MYKNDTRTFQEKLSLGQEKEDMLVEMLNWSGFSARRNNEESVTDIDIELIDDFIYIDSKLMETPFYKSQQYTGITPENCLTMQVRHINAYAHKQKRTGKETWIACFVDYKDFNVHELVFFKNSKLKELVDKTGSTTKLHFNRQNGFSFNFFLDYLNMRKTLRSQ